MNVVCKHLDTILNNAKHIAKEKGHIKTEKCLDELISKGVELFYFCGEGKFDNVSKYITNIKLLGKGTVTITCEDVVKTVDLAESHPTNITIEFKNKKIREYFIHGVNNITELDISNNEIYECVFDADNTINKLVIYNNNIEKLNCNSFKELQFLHMFNNPICGDLVEMKKVIKSLPDRNEKPFGSIIMYDWVNLGICGHFDSQNTRFCYDKELRYPIKKYSNEIYRDVESIDEPWYQYKDGKFKKLSEYNGLIEIRRQLEGLNVETREYTNEEGSIFKNWVFGSAIQYNKDAWECCGHHFKDAHIADVWETAEKGEGAGITTPDGTKFLQPSINIGRIYAYAHTEYPNLSTDNKGSGIKPVPRYTSSNPLPDNIKNKFKWIEEGCYVLHRDVGKYATDGFYHGDTCYSTMGDRGITAICDSMYGIAPEARYYLMSIESDYQAAFASWDSTNNDYLKLIGKTINCDVNKICTDYNINISGVATSANSVLEGVSTNDINIFTRSIGSYSSANELDSDPNHKFHRAMCTEIFKNICAFNAQGNSGDGLPWTTDQGRSNEDPAQYDNYRMGSECCFVTSVNTANKLSIYSSNDRTDKPYTYTYACHGESLKLHSPYELDKYITMTGTSGATPIHAAKTALLLIIFAKLSNFYKFDNNRKYWYIENNENNKANFINYLHHHLDVLPETLRSAVGNGSIDMLCYSNYEKADAEYTVTVVRNSPFKKYSTHPIHQITECSDGNYVNKSHYVKNDISKVIMTNRDHTLFMPLEQGAHEITVYNNDMNIIEDTNSIYHITDDKSEGVWYSKSFINVNEEKNLTSKVEEGLVCEITNSNELVGWTDCNNRDGWSISFVSTYNRTKSEQDETYICYTKDFYVRMSVKPSGSSARVQLAFSGISKDALKYTTYIALDCFNNEATNYRDTGYLGMVNGKKFILSIVKRNNSDLFDFYINGQYITSHKNTFEYDDEVSPISILPSTVEGSSVNNKHIAFTSMTLHNRPLTDEEVVQHSAYLHNTYINV